MSETKKPLLEALEEEAKGKGERLRTAFQRAEALHDKVKPFVKPLRPSTTSTAGMWQRESWENQPKNKTKC